MVSIVDNGKTFLSAPLATVLLYAADGLAVWNQSLSRAGRPRMPERAVWVPMFRQLVESSDGVRTLKSLAEAGLQGWGCPDVYFECLDAAFRELGLKGRIIALLDELAATARDRFVMLEPPHHPPAADIRPRPQKEKPRAGPRLRPQRRPRGPTPRPS